MHISCPQPLPDQPPINSPEKQEALNKGFLNKSTGLKVPRTKENFPADRVETGPNSERGQVLINLSAYGWSFHLFFKNMPEKNNVCFDPG